MSSEQVFAQLKQIKYPGFDKDIVSLGIVRSVNVSDNTISITLAPLSSGNEIVGKIQESVVTALKQSHPDYSVAWAGPGGGTAKKTMQSIPTAQAAPKPPGGGQAFGTKRNIPGVRFIIPIASGKGGVGKSTVSANLACALKWLGYKVGLLDLDVYGPSIPMMFGTRGIPEMTKDKKVIPIDVEGVKLVSIGFFIGANESVIWRGAMVHKVVEQFFFDVHWGELDFLLVDLPPGTGDTQLSLVQSVPLAGSVVVTTPQDLALLDVRRAIDMFKQTNIHILGIVENMSYFNCPHCNEKIDIFGSGGGKKESDALGIPLLGEIPIDPKLREHSDKGKPLVLADPKSPIAQIYTGMAEKIADQVMKTERKDTTKWLNISVKGPG